MAEVVWREEESSWQTTHASGITDERDFLARLHAYNQPKRNSSQALAYRLQ